MLCKRLLAASLAAFLLAPAAPVLAQKGKAKGGGKATTTAAANKGGRALPPINFTQFTLANGLRVILHEDHSTPIVGVNVWYHVGSKNEERGRTGFAHLFEHMMFQGFKGYDYDYIPVIQEVGGAINGSTNPDRTNYWQVVPSNFLETVLFMEAGRMGSLLEAMTETKLANQRDVVKNEKRQRIDNQPYGQAFARISEAMYPEGHPYRWLVIGSMEDLSAASLDDVKAFFRRYYVPNNASLVISGDFDPKEARALVEKYFGPIPKGEQVTPLKVPTPSLAREVREQIDDRVQLPRVYMVWHSAPQFSKDEAALDLLASILGGGKSGRLYKALQYDQQLAQSVSAFNQTSEIAGLLQIVATARPERSLEEIERAINAEVEKLKTAPPTPDEMERVYNAREASFVYGLQTVGGFGGKDDQLNAYATYVGRPDYFEQDLARYRAVTAADIQRVARQYLTDKRYVLSVVPRAAGQQSGAAGPAPASPREAIAPPSQQTAGTQQPGAANAASQTTPTGTASGTQQGAAQASPLAGAQGMTRPEAQAAQTSGAAPPQTASP
ncbi:MAG TPA: insulinase family protein, partial [Pyrinomonadaceae bacterium]|nr:insulinase family protein [Pyrinomonadaceae bacterium]